MHNSRRNYLHVRRADAVYAIGYRMLPDGSTPSLDIAGGTGVACTFYLDRFQHGGEDASSCQLYFFDEGGEAFDEGTFATDSATLHRWSKWDPIRERWQPMRTLPPLPSGLYAGIGASKLGPRARKAVQELYAQTAGVATRHYLVDLRAAVVGILALASCLRGGESGAARRGNNHAACLCAWRARRRAGPRSQPQQRRHDGHGNDHAAGNAHLGLQTV
jgi:hypothetical protein